MDLKSIKFLRQKKTLKVSKPSFICILNKLLVDTVSHDFKIALQKARQEKKLTQVELAQKVMEKQSVIAEYESGKAIPNNTVISKLERVLGMRLPKQKKEKAKKITE